MSIEKSFNEFIIVHGKKLMSKDVNSLENSTIDATNRASSILGAIGEADINKATVKFTEAINEFKKILIKHGLYEYEDV